MMMPTSDLAVAVGSACDPNKANPNSGFFGLAHWWKYIHTGQYDALGNCTPTVKFPGGLWPIGLALVDMLLFVAGLVAVGSIIYAGVEYLSTMGNAEKGVSARKRIVNSLIGLAIVIIAIPLISLIGNRLGS